MIKKHVSILIVGSFICSSTLANDPCASLSGTPQNQVSITGDSNSAAQNAANNQLACITSGQKNVNSYSSPPNPTVNHDSDDVMLPPLPSVKTSPKKNTPKKPRKNSGIFNF